MRTTGFSFAEKIEFRTVRNENGCLIWTGSLTDRGYPQMHWEGRNRKVHRLVLERKLGRPIQPGLGALHCCPNKHNTRCLEPTHLYEGNQRDNVRDAKKQKTHSDPPIHFGEHHHKAVLTEREVYEIRASDKTQMELAQEFEISQAVISKIIRREIWTHLPARKNDRRSGFDRLSDATKDAIRRLAKRSERSYRSIAEEYGVSHHTVSRIMRE